MRPITRTLLLLLALLLPATALAHDFEVDGIYYNIVNGNEVEVTFQGANYSSYNEYSGSVTIPSTATYNGTTYQVTAIGKFAFRNNADLTGVTIPNTVKRIGNSAFSGCTNLSDIQMPNSVTDIGYSAFSKTSWYNDQPDGLVFIGLVLYAYKGEMPADTSITIKDGTLGIAGDAFYNCSGMTSITIPNSVVTISNWAFEGCTGLTSMTIPNSVVTIDNYAFYGCASLASTTIGNSVSLIGDYAFYDCTSLTSVNLPNSVTSIGKGAFYNCSSLTCATIPTSVSLIGDYAFTGCSLENLTVASGNTNYDSRENCNAIIETTSNTLICGCRNTVIPNSVTAIGNNAFFGCTGLTNITIPNSVTTIGERAFSGCSGLSDITIPSSVTSIGEKAFTVCSGLTNITVASGNPMYDSRDNCNAIIETASNTLIFGFQNTVIPNSVTAIGNNAFASCTGLTSLTLPNSVTTIGNNAFNNCTGLTSLTLPNSLTTIGDIAFEGCTGLTGDLTLPNSLATIGSSAFSNCTGLTRLTLPSSVRTIGDNAFGGCNALNDVYSFIHYYPDDDWFSMGYGLFAMDGDYSSRTLHVPAGYSRYYQQDSRRWSQYFGNIVEMPSQFEVDGIYYTLITAREVAVTSYYDHTYTGHVVIPEAVTYEGQTYCVTTIGNWAFDACTKLTSVSIPNSVTTIGLMAFDGCYNLTSVTLPESVATAASIGERAFRGCFKLKEINIPDGVTSIGDGAFEACYRLTEVTIPRSLRSIGISAFGHCYSLSHVVWNALNCVLEYEGFDFEEDCFPFEYCPVLKKITIGTEVESIGDEIFCIFDPVYNNIDTVVCLATQPPVITEDCFWTYTYQNATLCVPYEAMSSYGAAEGWKNFVSCVAADLEPVMLGDVDGDGRVSIADVTDLIDYLLNHDDTAINSINSDLDGDRNVTIADVTDLIDMLLNDN